MGGGSTHLKVPVHDGAVVAVADGVEEDLDQVTRLLLVVVLLHRGEKTRGNTQKECSAIAINDDQDAW